MSSMPATSAAEPRTDAAAASNVGGGARNRSERPQHIRTTVPVLQPRAVPPSSCRAAHAVTKCFPAQPAPTYNSVSSRAQPSRPPDASQPQPTAQTTYCPVTLQLPPSFRSLAARLPPSYCPVAPAAAQLPPSYRPTTAQLPPNYRNKLLQQTTATNYRQLHPGCPQAPPSHRQPPSNRPVTAWLAPRNLNCTLLLPGDPQRLPPATPHRPPPASSHRSRSLSRSPATNRKRPQIIVDAGCWFAVVCGLSRSGLPSQRAPRAQLP